MSHAQVVTNGIRLDSETFGDPTDPPVLLIMALDTELPNSTRLTLEGSGHELHRGDWPTILDAIEKHTRR